MIATHNIKVNGRWVHAGESYEAAEPVKKAEKPVKPVKEPEQKPAEEPPKAEPVKEEKPRTASNRRKAGK